MLALMLAVAAVDWTMRGPYPGTVMVASIPLAMMLAWGAAVDLHDFIVPDTVSLGLIPLGLIATLAIAPSAILAHVVASAVAGGLLWALAEGYDTWRGRSGLGLGDVKLFAAAGAWLGPHGLPGALLIGALMAILAILIRQIVHGRRHLRRRIAFAPHLSLGIWFIWICGPLTWGV